MHQGRRDTLYCPNPLTVETELQDVGGLRVPRELRVQRLVAPRAERRRRLDAHQEVSHPTPPLPDECSLEDDIHTGAHRLHCLAGGALPVEVGLERHLRDRLTLVLQPLQISGLVLTPLPKHELHLLVLHHRPHQVATRNPQVERSQVGAGQIRRKIGR